MPAKFHCPGPGSGALDVTTLAGRTVEVSSVGRTSTAPVDAAGRAELGQFLSLEPGETFAAVLDADMLAGKGGKMELDFTSEGDTSKKTFDCALVK